MLENHQELGTSLFYTCCGCGETIHSHYLNSHTQGSPSCSTYRFHNQDFFNSLKDSLNLLSSYSSIPNFPKKIRFPFEPTNDLTISQIKDLENFILLYHNSLITSQRKKALISDVLADFLRHSKVIRVNEHLLEILSKEAGLLIGKRSSYTIIAYEGSYCAGRNPNSSQVIIYNTQDNAVKSVLYNTDKKYNVFGLVLKFNYFIYLVQSFICFWDYCKNSQYCCIPRDNESTKDYFFHSKHEQIFVYFSFSAISVWDVAKLEKTQKFLLDFKVKQVSLSNLFKKSVYYSCVSQGEIWKVDCLNGKNELILVKALVHTIVSIGENDDFIVVFIGDLYKMQEVLVYDTVSKTTLHKVGLHEVYKINNFHILKHNTKAAFIDTLCENFKTYSLENAKVKTPKQNTLKRKKNMGLKSLRKTLNLEILELYLDQSKQTLFAICSKFNSKVLLIHNLSNNSNTFYSISSDITSLSLSVSNYIIFNSQHFFVFWDLRKAEIESVMCLGKGSLYVKTKAIFEFNLREFYDDWVVYKGKYLVHSTKNFTKTVVYRLIRQKTKSLGKFESPPLCLKENKMWGVYKGCVSVLMSNGIQEKCVEVKEKNQRSLFSAAFDEEFFIVGYRDRCFVINILKNEVCGEFGYASIDKVISVKSFPNTGLIVVHEINKFLVFTNKYSISLITVNYKFSKQKGLSIKVTDNMLYLLLINKEVMIVLNLKNSQQEEIKYNSTRAFVENIIFINSTYFVLFVNTYKFTFKNAGSLNASVDLNTQKFEILIGNIVNTKERRCLSFKEKPNIQKINGDILLLYEPSSSFIVHLNENLTFTTPNIALLKYLKKNSYPGADFWDLLSEFMKSNTRLEFPVGKLIILPSPDTRDKIALISESSKLFLFNISTLAIDRINLPFLKDTIPKDIFYSSSVHSLLIITGKNIKTLWLSDLTFTTLTCFERNLLSHHLSSPGYAVVNIRTKDARSENLIFSLSSFNFLYKYLELQISDIVIFSLPNSLLFTRINLLNTMGTFNISKLHEPITTLKRYFEYSVVFKRFSDKDEKEKTMELKVFCDINKEVMVLVYDGKFLIVDIGKLEVLVSLGSSIINEFTFVEFSQSGKYIGFGNDRGMVYCWDRKTGCIRNFFYHMNPVVFISFNFEDEGIMSYAEGEENLLINSL